MNVPGKDVLGNLQDQMSLQDITENILVSARHKKIA